jgi:hypothetical protein
VGDSPVRYVNNTVTKCYCVKLSTTLIINNALLPCCCQQQVSAYQRKAFEWLRELPVSVI